MKLISNMIAISFIILNNWEAISGKNCLTLRYEANNI